MRILKSLALATAGFCAFLCVLASVAYTQITSSAQMLNGFYQFADTSLKGVPASAYSDYATAITRYLAGQRDGLTVTAADGTERPGFSERELTHMADVRGLVQTLNALRYVCGGLALAGFGLYFYGETAKKGKSRETALHDILNGAAAGAYLLLGLILALVIWGAVDFNSLFLTFHRVMFRNDLWLLNPREHLLIMLMPTPFFVWYARQIALACWPALALMVAVIIGRSRIGREKSQ